MRTLVGAFIGLALTASVVQAQSTGRILSSPELLPREDLERLNLVEGWHTYLPTDGRRDGISSVQLFDKQVVVLLRSGTLVAIDAATGATQWRNRVGVPYIPAVGLASNKKLILVAKGVSIFAFSRTDGNLLWEFNLPNAPSAAPVADEDRFFVPMGTNRLYAFELPDLNAPRPRPVADTEAMVSSSQQLARQTAEQTASAPRTASAFGVSGQAVRSVGAVFSGGSHVRSIGALSSATAARQVDLQQGPQPGQLWDYVTETQPETRIEQSSILTSDYLFQAGANGLFFVLSKYEPRMFYRFQADAAVSAPIGGYGELAYVPSDDYRVYALDIVQGKILWRFVGGGPIRQKPQVTDDSVYVNAERAGLYRLDRATGDTIWRNQDADRFLAANNRFVYAMDRSRRLLVLDRARGAQLAIYGGTRGFHYPISNEQNDRIYLASNDGLLLSLHDRNLTRPLRVKNAPEMKPLFSKEQPESGKKKPATKEKAKLKPEKKKDEDSTEK